MYAGGVADDSPWNWVSSQQNGLLAGALRELFIEYLCQIRSLDMMRWSHPKECIDSLSLYDQSAAAAAV